MPPKAYGYQLGCQGPEPNSAALNWTNPTVYFDAPVYFHAPVWISTVYLSMRKATKEICTTCILSKEAIEWREESKKSKQEPWKIRRA